MKLKQLTQKQWNDIASYMDDEIRERIHAERVPCTEQEFLDSYLEENPGFADLLKNEFYYCFETP